MELSHPESVCVSKEKRGKNEKLRQPGMGADKSPETSPERRETRLALRALRALKLGAGAHIHINMVNSSGRINLSPILSS